MKVVYEEKAKDKEAREEDEIRDGLEMNADSHKREGESSWAFNIAEEEGKAERRERDRNEGTWSPLHVL